MTDDVMLAMAKVHASCVLAAPDMLLPRLLDLDFWFEEQQDAVCMGQQLIAEATGLVGMVDG